FLALGHFELDALAFGQGLEAAALDLAEVGEQVLTAGVRGNEAEALFFVEPLDDAGLGHVDFLLMSVAQAHADAVQKRQETHRWEFRPSLPENPAGAEETYRNTVLNRSTKQIVHEAGMRAYFYFRIRARPHPASPSSTRVTITWSIL